MKELLNLRMTRSPIFPILQKKSVAGVATLKPPKEDGGFFRVRCGSFPIGGPWPDIATKFEGLLGFEHFRVLLFPNNLKKSTTF